MTAAMIAGTVSTLLFVGSTLPMVLRAARTRDLSSYSRGALTITNAGNAVHTIYVVSLPAGPLWLLHLVYSGAAAFMLIAHVWWVEPPIATRGSSATGSQEAPYSARTSRPLSRETGASVLLAGRSSTDFNQLR